MADEKKSFQELLSGAPLATKEDTITLVGVLERSHQPGKFVLVLGLGRDVTLDVSAVRDYRVLAGMVGQTLVEIDVDRDHVPREVRDEITKGTKFDLSDQPHTVLEYDRIPKIIYDPPGTGWRDNPSLGNEIKYIADHYYAVNPGIGPGPGPGPEAEMAYNRYYAQQEASLAAMQALPYLRRPPKDPWEDPGHLTGPRDVPYTGPYDPHHYPWNGPQWEDPASGLGGYYGGYGAVPFALATPHQGPASAIAAMGRPSSFGHLIFTYPWQSADKPPPADWTLPGHPHHD